MMGGDSCGDGGDVDEAEDESQFRATIESSGSWCSFFGRNIVIDDRNKQ